MIQQSFSNTAVRAVCSRQVAGTHQKLIDNFPAGKTEGFFKKLYPVFFGLRVMLIDPDLKTAKFLLEC
jgi:ribosomal protein L6P/L9E